MLIDRLRKKLSVVAEVTLPFRRVSFSATGEDLLIAEALKRMGVSKPFYFDIGANHPVRMNNTYAFYREGASGTCVEPQPLLWKAFRRARPRDTCLNVGVAARASSPMPFYVFENPALSTFSGEQAEMLVQSGQHSLVETTSVPILAVNDLLARAPRDATSFVSLDCEGMDLDILAGIDFEAHRPAVFCIETARPSVDGSPQLGPKIQDIDLLLRSKGYWAFADTYVNTIYVDERRLRLGAP